MKKLKILQINTFENIGGAARVASRLNSEFSKSNYSSLLVGKKSSNIDVTALEPFSSLKKLRRITNKIERFSSLQYFFNPSYFWSLRKKNYADYDIINLHNIHGDYFNILSLLKLLKHKKVIWTLHDMWAMTGHCALSFGCEGWRKECEICPHLDYYPALRKDKAHYLFKLKKKILSHPNLHLVTPSDWLRKLVNDSMHPKNKISLIYNGIDHKLYKPMNKTIIRKRLKINQDKQVILFSSIGRKNQYKGFNYLIKALNKIKNKEQIILLILGDNNKFELDGFETINVGLIYSEKKIAEYYACADMLLYPSLQDNCPLVVLEAMSSGLPIVTFNTGGIPELIQHKKTGYIAKYKDVNDLSNGINLLIKNATIRKNYGLQSRKIIVKKYTLKKQAQSYLNLYRDVLKNDH